MKQNMHHQFINCNYGLYFHRRGRMMGANHPDYYHSFNKVAGRNEAVTVKEIGDYVKKWTKFVRLKKIPL